MFRSLSNPDKASCLIQPNEHMFRNNIRYSNETRFLRFTAIIIPLRFFSSSNVDNKVEQTTTIDDKTPQTAVQHQRIARAYLSHQNDINQMFVRPSR